MGRIGLFSGVLAVSVATALILSMGAAIAGGWNHDYTDPSYDVTYDSADITRVRSYAQGTDVVLELTVRGEIEDSPELVYWVYVGAQASGAGMTYVNGIGLIIYVGGGSSMGGVTKSGSTLTGRIPKADAGSEANFDIVGYAIHAPSGQSAQVDWAGSAYQDGTGGQDQAPGMPLWLIATLILVPLIVVIAIVAVVLTAAKRKPTSMQQPQYPVPPGMAPQYPPQQYQQPQQPGQQRPPGQ